MSPLKPVHPGDVLREDFMKPMELTGYRLAKAINVPPQRINDIVHCKRAVTAETDLRLARYFGISEGNFHDGGTATDRTGRDPEPGAELEVGRAHRIHAMAAIEALRQCSLYELSLAAVCPDRFQVNPVEVEPRPKGAFMQDALSFSTLNKCPDFVRFIVMYEARPWSCGMQIVRGAPSW